MSFIHEDPEFPELLRAVGIALRLDPGLVEKDYWVTHTLWALQETGLEIWFKGGTSLSKGFGLIQRFSEDLDLKIEPGPVKALPPVANWRSDGKKATLERQAYFQALPPALKVPGATTTLDDEGRDETWRCANIRVTYPGTFFNTLGNVLRPYVLLEVGSARVTPFLRCSMTSFVHNELIAQGQLPQYEDNRPREVRCVHPLVTLVEKLDLLHKRVLDEKTLPAKFVRHFEDCAHIIQAEALLPRLPDYDSLQTFVAEMLEQKQIVMLPDSGDLAFLPDKGLRWQTIQSAHKDIAPMFWGPRIAIDECCALIREWIRKSGFA